jgi:preprotein translocase subunit SecG
MLDILLNVFYVLIAISMIVLILLQRGAGAQAGSGFGAGASGTVFGARGSANFLSSSTKYLAAVFFAMSLFMAYQASHRNKAPAPAEQDLGVMANLPAQPATPAPATSTTTQLAPAPAAAEPAPAAGAPATGETPAALPPPTQSTPVSPAEGSKGG